MALWEYSPVEGCDAAYSHFSMHGFCQGDPCSLYTEGSRHTVRSVEGGGSESSCTVEHLLAAPLKRKGEYSVLVTVAPPLRLDQAQGLFPGFLVSEVEDGSLDGLEMIGHILQTRASRGTHSNRIASWESVCWVMARGVRRAQREALVGLKRQNGVVARSIRRAFRGFAVGLQSIGSIHDIGAFLDLLPRLVETNRLC